MKCVMVEFEGSVKSKLVLCDDKIIIYPEKLPFERQEEIVVFLSKISGVTIKKPGIILNDGYIHIEVPGMNFHQTTVSFKGKEKYIEAVEVKKRII